MMMHWVRKAASGKWHAWFHGAPHVVCGAVTAGMLRDGPVEIQQTIEPGAHVDLCRKCRRKVGASLSGPVPVAPGSAVDYAPAWAGYIRRHLSTVHATVKDDDIATLSTLLAEVGAPDDPHAREVWEQVRALLLTPWAKRFKDRAHHTRTKPTISHLGDALAHIPMRTGALTQLAAALKTWRTVTGQTVHNGRYRSDHVVAVMLQVPDVESYVRRLQSNGLDHLGAVFHPNTLARAKRDTGLRGTFAGSGSYWEAAKDQLTIVTE